MKTLSTLILFLAFNTFAATTATQTVVCDADLVNLYSANETKIELGNENQFDGCTFGTILGHSSVETEKDVVAQCQVIYGNSGQLVFTLTVTESNGKLEHILAEEIDYEMSARETDEGKSFRVIKTGNCQYQ